ncbi:MAG: ribonuclease H-like domain-containing protein, partial [Nitrospirota bacterium]
IMSRKVVIDIETIGRDFESLDEMSREYLLKYAETEEEVKEVREGLAFSPLTGEIVAIGMLGLDTNSESSRSDKCNVYFQSPALFHETLKQGEAEFIPDSEAGILKRFWDAVKHYDQIITFNGRAFDAPFIMIRSAVHKIKPTKDLMPNRYSATAHVDLLDQLTFYGSVRRKFSLHMWCKALGIKSPKEGGITGLQVKELFENGKYAEIANYCRGDLYATKELFEYWEKFIKFPPG